MKKLSILVIVLVVSLVQGCATINFESYNQDGQRARDGGNYQTAIEHWETGLAEARARHDKPYIMTFLRNLGDLYGRQFQFQQEFETYEELITLARELSLPAQEAYALRRLGERYQDQKEDQKALELYEQALTVIRPLNNFDEEGEILISMSEVYRDLNQLLKAKECNERAVALAPKMTNWYIEGRALRQLGYTYDALGQIQEAIACFEKAASIFRQRSVYGGVADSLRDLGNVYLRHQRYQEAAEVLEQAVPLFRKYHRDWFASMEALSDLGNVYQRLKKYQQAVESYGQAMDILETVRGGFSQEQISHMQRYLKVYDDLLNLFLDLHRYEPDQGYDRRALETFERKQGRLFLSEMARSGARRFSGVPDAVLQQVSDVENEIEETHAQVVDERSRPPDEGRFKLTTLSFQNLAQNGMPAPILEKLKPLENIDLMKADVLTAVEVAIGKEATKTYADLVLKHLVALLDELEARERALTTEQETLHTQMKRDYPDYDALQNPQPTSLAEMQQQILQPGELLLVYAVMENTTVVWAINRDTFQICICMRLGGESWFQRDVNALRKALRIEYEQTRGLPKTVKDEDLRKESFVEISHDLYSQLIPKEIRPLLTQAQSLTIVPTGSLYALPFEALVTSPPKGEGTGVRFLIEDVPINYLSSASLLKILREAESRRTTLPTYPLLAFADPVYGTLTPTPLPKGERTPTPEEIEEQIQRTAAYRAFFQDGFTQLPETADEVQAIATVLNAPDESAPLQLKEQASRSSVFAFQNEGRLDDYRYLVFATHGVLPGEVDQITQPALVLSYPEQDGYLTMADVFQLKCNADLISLSACNTGMGEQQANEGVIGLTRAFMFAGTPVVSVTLWSVESQSAKELNVGLFEQLAAGQSPAQALQAAKLSLLHGEKGDRYQHPYYWAPFVLFGDGR